MKTMKAEYESALDRLRADMAGQKVWLFALVTGAVVTGTTLGLALSRQLSLGSDPLHLALPWGIAETQFRPSER